MTDPYVSIIVPVFNKDKLLQPLIDRINSAMNNLGRRFEIIFTHDGSQNLSLEILKEFVQRYPGVKLVEFAGNFGQQMAILAAFECSNGEIVITLDADLQNPPEVIPRMVSKIEKGHDMVSTIPEKRYDPLFTKVVVRIVNLITTKIVGKRVSGCTNMFRAYHRNIIDHINACDESVTFIPALAQTFSTNAAEIIVGHAKQTREVSKYSIYSLIRLNFDLITGFSLVPQQLFTLPGIITSLLAVGFAMFLLVRRFMIGAEVEGIFTLFAILFFFIGIIIFGIGIVGEYMSRIHKEARQRPRFEIRKTYGFE